MQRQQALGRRLGAELEASICSPGFGTLSGTALISPTCSRHRSVSAGSPKTGWAPQRLTLRPPARRCVGQPDPSLPLRDTCSRRTRRLTVARFRLGGRPLLYRRGTAGSVGRQVWNQADEDHHCDQLDQGLGDHSQRRDAELGR